MQLTWLNNNSWLLEIAGKTILLDPWLVGDLVFGNLPWLFTAKHNLKPAIPEKIDLILLSQGLEDHAHPATLKELDHQLPVVASPNGAKVVTNLGYNQVTSLAHQETFIFEQKVEITALPGSPVGPTLVENGYLLKDLETGETLYYEPHGFHSPQLKKLAPIDVIITPLINIKIPFLGPVIQGQKKALEVCQWLQPKVILSTAAGGDVTFEGLLASILKMEGTIGDFQNLLVKNDLETKVIEPKPNQLINTFNCRLG
jgi:L-ascorbate metabolism protein UlaG (beta-lactamase superfamily)